MAAPHSKNEWVTIAIFSPGGGGGGGGVKYLQLRLPIDTYRLKSAWEGVGQQNGSSFVGALLDKGGGIGQGGRGFRR